MSIQVDATVDIDYSELSEKVAAQQDEATLLRAMADEAMRTRAQSGDEKEQAFMEAMAVKLTALAEWLEDNEP